MMASADPSRGSHQATAQADVPTPASLARASPAAEPQTSQTRKTHRRPPQPAKTLPGQHTRNLLEIQGFAQPRRSPTPPAKSFLGVDQVWGPESGTARDRRTIRRDDKPSRHPDFQSLVSMVHAALLRVAGHRQPQGAGVALLRAMKATAAGMANAYAKATDEPTLLSVHSGPGGPMR
jgi:hypothetical protein